MKRRLLIAALAFGTLFGFSTGFASLSHGWHHRAERRQADFEAHIADVCVEAAHRVQRPDDEAWDRPPPAAPRWRGDARHESRRPRGGW